jgi:PadR family transcriptional regulator
VPERITRQLLSVLEAFLEDPASDLYGLEIMESAHVSSGTLYPILHRLAEEGWIVRTRDAPSDRGGPGRRMYRLTPTGRLRAIEVLDERGLLSRRLKTKVFKPGVQPA